MKRRIPQSIFIGILCAFFLLYAMNKIEDENNTSDVDMTSINFYFSTYKYSEQVFKFTSYDSPYSRGNINVDKESVIYSHQRRNNWV